MKRLVLVTGGARSGKSKYAQERAEAIAGAKCFLATCPSTGLGMEERIRKHKEDRVDKGWNTIEEQLDIAAVLKNTHYSIYLLDCLTLWINNILYSYETKNDICGEEEILANCEQLVNTIVTLDAHVFLVTNEVGMSIVPENSTARLYRDLVGRCNQYLAQAADEVILVNCGLPLQLK